MSKYDIWSSDDSCTFGPPGSRGEMAVESCQVTEGDERTIFDLTARAIAAMYVSQDYIEVADTRDLQKPVSKTAYFYRVGDIGIFLDGAVMAEMIQG